MSAVAARCPHCGTVQSRAAAVVSAASSRSARAPDAAPPVLKEVSTAEARAILAIAAARDGRIDESDDEPGLFAALLLPHPRSAGLARGAEIVLTVIAAPLIACSMIGAFFAWRAVRHADRAMERGLTVRVVALFSGTGILSSVNLFTDVSDEFVWGLIAVCWVSLLARAGVRAFVRGRRRPADLTR